MTRWILLVVAVALLATNGIARGEASASLYLVGEDLQSGYLDAGGKVVLSGFAEAGDFTEGLAPVKMGGGYGFIDHTGKAVIPPRYRAAGNFSDGLAGVEIGAQWGYMDKTGTLVIPADFDDVHDFHDGLAAAKVDDKYELIDKTGSVVIPPTYEKMRVMSEGLIAVCQNGKWGYVDKTGAMIIAPQYDEGGRFVNGMAPVKSNGKYGYIDPIGRMAVEAKYDDARPFSDGLAGVATITREVKRNAQGMVVMMRVTKRWGYIDPSGQVVIPLELWDTGQFSEGKAAAWKDDRFYYIDKTGAMVVTPLFYCKTAGSYHDGLACITIGKRYGYLHADGSAAIPEQFSDAEPFSDGLAAVEPEPDGYWGYIDASGQMVISPRFEAARPFHNGLARVKDYPPKWGLVDRTGTFTLKPQFDEIGWVTDQIVAGKMDKLWGFYDLTGKAVLDPQFDAASFLGDDRAIVRKDHKYGVVDAAGKEIVPPQYDDCGWLYVDGLLPVTQDGKAGLLDTAGTMAIAPQYESVAGFTPDHLCAVKVDGKWGFIDRESKMVIPPRYDRTTGFSGGYAAVELDGKWGFINTAGTAITEPQYAATGSFSDGLAPVEVNEQWGYLDATGKLAIPAHFDVAEDFVDGIAKVKEGERDGYLATDEKLLWRAQLDQMSEQFPAGLTQADCADTTATPADAQGVRIITVQVAADQYFRQRPDWRAIIRKRLDAVSDIYQKSFNIRFAIGTIVPWESPDYSEEIAPEDYFTKVYDSLMQNFPPLDAELVIGFTGQKQKSPELGLSICFARHVIIDDDFNANGDKEDFATMITVHELGHLFGGFHVDDPQSFMYYAGSPNHAGDLSQWHFDQYNTRQLQLVRSFDFRKGMATLDDETIKQSTADFLAGRMTIEMAKNGSPPVSKGYLSRGQSFAEKDEFCLAVRDYRRAVALSHDTEFDANYGNLGLALFRERRFAESLAALRKAAALDPNAAYWHAMLARELRALQLQDATLMECRQDLTPPLATIYRRYLLTKVDPDEILTECRVAVKDDPKVALYHELLGNALLAKGDTQAALPEYQQAVDLAPNNQGFAKKLQEVKDSLAPAAQ